MSFRSWIINVKEAFGSLPKPRPLDWCAMSCASGSKSKVTGKWVTTGLIGCYSGNTVWLTVCRASTKTNLKSIRFETREVSLEMWVREEKMNPRDQKGRINGVRLASTSEAIRCPHSNAGFLRGLMHIVGSSYRSSPHAVWSQRTMEMSQITGVNRFCLIAG